MSGAANARIDDPEVFGVCRLEFPPSIIDVSTKKRVEQADIGMPILNLIGAYFAYLLSHTLSYSSVVFIILQQPTRIYRTSRHRKPTYMIVSWLLFCHNIVFSLGWR
jgi:hypothetical protein